MNSSRQAILLQQKTIQKQIKNNAYEGIFNYLNTPEILAMIDSQSPPHRKQKFPPAETVSMFVGQALNDNRSCQYAVDQSAVKRVLAGTPPCSTDTGSYCRARQRLSQDMLFNLTSHLSLLIDEKVPDDWRWKGRKVKIVDGTTVSMPDTELNQEKYPQPKSQKEGLGFPICRIVAITCMSSGSIIDAKICPIKGKGSSEQTLLRKMQGSLHKGDVLLADAFFPTYFLIADMQKKELTC